MNEKIKLELKCVICSKYFPETLTKIFYYDSDEASRLCPFCYTDEKVRLRNMSRSGINLY